MSNGNLLLTQRFTINRQIKRYLELEVDQFLDLLCAILLFLFKGFDLVFSAKEV